MISSCSATGVIGWQRSGLAPVDSSAKLLPPPEKAREIMQQAGSMILAQKLARLMAGSRLFRAGVAIVLPFIGVVAAFGIAPDTVTEPVPRREVVQELVLPTTR